MDSVSKYMEQQNCRGDLTKDRSLEDLTRKIRIETVFTLAEIREDNFKRGLYKNLLNDFLKQLYELKDK